MLKTGNLLLQISEDLSVKMDALIVFDLLTNKPKAYPSAAASARALRTAAQARADTPLRKSNSREPEISRRIPPSGTI